MASHLQQNGFMLQLKKKGENFEFLWNKYINCFKEYIGKKRGKIESQNKFKKKDKISFDRARRLYEGCL